MFEKIIETIKSASKIAIFTHTNPDGDAMGSSYSLKLALKAIGKRAEVYLEDGYETAAWSLIRGKESDGLEFSDCDLAVALDCGDVFRLGSHEDDFLKFDNSIAIDHHITHKEFAKSGTVIENISSTCELIYGLYVEMGIFIDTDIANNLYIGLISDTGNFKYSSVTSKTHIVAANLIDSGVNFA
ncbi:MAG: DHH family phosphoesterase, partial [Oscillospiraceae bacterium]